ncbi:MAG: glycosyltransferase, partial [Parcubacteria group bacterium]
MRVLYLVSRENILEPGVLKSQVLDLAGQLVENSPSTELTVLNFPSVNRFFASLRSYQSVKRYARRMGVRLIIVPILPIGRSVMPVWAIPLFLIQTIPFVLFFALASKIDIIHARAYLSALLAHLLRKGGLKVGFIFDMRGAYLLEGVTYGRWNRSDTSYKIWERIEKSLFSDSDRVVVQSEGLADYVKKVMPDARVELIPPCVKERDLSAGRKEREIGRKRLGVADRFVVVYSGSLGSFHEPDFLAKSYAEIRKHLPNSYFLVATHSDPKELDSFLRKRGVPTGEFRVILSPKDPEEVLNIGDVGLHVMGDLPITSTVIAVKFGEYLAAGLPVIVSKNLVSITDLVDKYRCGVVIDRLDQKDVRVKMQKLVKERETIKRNA